MYTKPCLSIATVGSLLASQKKPSPVMRKPSPKGSIGTSLSVHVAPLSVEKTYFVVLTPPPARSKSLTAATRLLGLFGSTAMCSSASGKVLVGVTIPLGCGAGYAESVHVAARAGYGPAAAWRPPR